MNDPRVANPEVAGRVLSQEEQLQVREFCDLSADFIALCQKTGKSRELSLAITNMQQARFWALEHVTGPKP
jgi:hypothetical protein